MNNQGMVILVTESGLESQSSNRCGKECRFIHVRLGCFISTLQVWLHCYTVLYVTGHGDAFA